MPFLLPEEIILAQENIDSMPNFRQNLKTSLLAALQVWWKTNNFIMPGSDVYFLERDRSTSRAYLLGYDMSQTDPLAIIASNEEKGMNMEQIKLLKVDPILISTKFNNYNP